MEWKEREQHRFDIGLYQNIPLWDELFGGIIRQNKPLHYPHVCPSDNSLLEYTVHEDKGIKDEKNVIKPGRYLKKYFSDIFTDGDIEEYTVLWDNKFRPLPLKLTQNGEESAIVTINGPRTCMQPDESEWNTGIHPHRVYDLSQGTDLTISYIGELDSPRAFAVVWPEKKIYTNIYGDSRMERSLEIAGYKESDPSEFEGARILKIEEKGVLVLPYIDQSDYCRESGNFIVLDSNGNIQCNNTNGYVGELQACCHCGEEIHNGEEYSHDGDIYCDSCFYENFSYCGDCEEAVPIDLTHLVDGGDRYVCDYCWDTSYKECVHDGEYYLEDDMLEIFNEDGDETGKYIYKGNLKDSKDFYMCTIDEQVYPAELTRVVEEGKIVFFEYAERCEGFKYLHFLKENMEEINGKWFSIRWINDISQPRIPGL